MHSGIQAVNGENLRRSWSRKCFKAAQIRSERQMRSRDVYARPLLLFPVESHSLGSIKRYHSREDRVPAVILTLDQFKFQALFFTLVHPFLFFNWTNTPVRYKGSQFVLFPTTKQIFHILATTSSVGHPTVGR